MSSFPGQVFKYLITFPCFSNPPPFLPQSFPLLFHPPSFFLRILFYFLHFTSPFLRSSFIFPSHPILLSAFHLLFSSILLHFSFASYSTFCISLPLFFHPTSFFLRILFYFLHFTSPFLPFYFIFPSHPILLSAFHLISSLPIFLLPPYFLRFASFRPNTIIVHPLPLSHPPCLPPSPLV